jgi:hypothetical protein
MKKKKPMREERGWFTRSISHKKETGSDKHKPDVVLPENSL